MESDPTKREETRNGEAAAPYWADIFAPPFLNFSDEILRPLEPAVLYIVKLPQINEPT